MLKHRINSSAQIWLETVIYILIGLALIGLVLGFITPKINEKKDRLVVEQTLIALNVLDSKVKEVIESGQFNKRVVEFKMQRGNLFISPERNEILFVLDGLSKPYSEPNVDIPLGRVILRTTEGKKTSSVSLTLQYGEGTDITFDGAQEEKKVTPSGAPYKFAFENKGQVDNGGNKAYQVDITRLS
ncbi:MAG: hypothetical protein Q7S27_02110 [Nanoarchaeota archaeon]|nr:hypothetical protein [Nanoarchaeota archaeon]